MQETLHQTANAGDTIRQRKQESPYPTADAGDFLSANRCRSLSIRQRMQETLYQTADAGDSCIRCLIESLLHQMSERETSASAV